jgi:hypothetical protein
MTVRFFLFLYIYTIPAGRLSPLPPPFWPLRRLLRSNSSPYSIRRPYINILTYSLLFFWSVISLNMGSCIISPKMSKSSNYKTYNEGTLILEYFEIWYPFLMIWIVLKYSIYIKKLVPIQWKRVSILSPRCIGILIANKIYVLMYS